MRHAPAAPTGLEAEPEGTQAIPARAEPPIWKPWLAQIQTELLLTLRQGEQLLVSVGIPLGILVFFSVVDVLPTDTKRPVDFLAPATLALAVMSTSLVSLGIGTGFDRDHSVLKRLGTTPLGRGRWIAAKIATVVIIELVQAAVLLFAAFALGWRPSGAWPAVVLALVLGTAAFSGLALSLAGRLRAMANLAVVNSLYLLLLVTGGMAIPLDRLPGPMEHASVALPSGAMSAIVTGAMIPGRSIPTAAWWSLVAWAVTTPLLAARVFRWEP